MLMRRGARRDGPIPRDFEKVDDNRSLNELNGLGRRFSVDTIENFRTLSGIVRAVRTLDRYLNAWRRLHLEAVIVQQDARRDGPIPRDFEKVDDNRSLNELNGLGRRFSVGDAGRQKPQLNWEERKIERTRTRQQKRWRDPGSQPWIAMRLPT
jgi:hypothetical protein